MNGSTDLPAADIDDVDPDIRRFQQIINADYLALSGGAYADVAARRRVAEQVRRRWAAGGPAMAASTDLTIGPRRLRARLHRPSLDPDLPVLVYVHGGGWVLFSIDSHDRLMRDYAARSGCAVLGVDYSLSPEARFPAALDDVTEAVDWLRAEGAAHGIDPHRMALGGDSAGGNLALSTALRLRDAGQGVQALLLNYGAFDTEIRASHARYDGDRYMLTADEMVAFWRDYLGDDLAPQDVLARPLRADPAGLPPTFLCIAECDILADENLEMARRLRARGVDVDARVYRGATHSFLEAASISPLAERAIDEAASWLQSRLRG